MGKKRFVAEIVCILDRSGSMQPAQRSAVDEFNRFMENQKEIPGDAYVTVAFFNTAVTYVTRDVPVRDVPALTATMYQPNGYTAYYDSVFRVVEETQARIEKMEKKDRPDTIICVILTDGQDNRSRHNAREVAALREKLEQGIWTFVDLTCGSEAATVASLSGGAQGSRAVFDHTPMSMKATMGGMDHLLASARKAGSSGGQHLIKASMMAMRSDPMDVAHVDAEEMASSFDAAMEKVTSARKKKVT